MPEFVLMRPCLVVVAVNFLPFLYVGISLFSTVAQASKQEYIKFSQLLVGSRRIKYFQECKVPLRRYPSKVQRTGIAHTQPTGSVRREIGGTWNLCDQVQPQDLYISPLELRSNSSS